MFNRSFLVAIVIVSPLVLAASFDPPDLSLEYRMHRAFQGGLSSTLSAEYEEGTIENYKLQKGESLWDLSQMLYGDGSYWPKVWAQNREIANPHLIRKGHTLQLLMGSEEQAPAFRFSEEGDGGLELAAASEEGSAVLEIPPPEIPPRRLINIPKSFPAWEDVYKKIPDQISIDDSLLRPNNIKLSDRIFLNGFVQEAKLDPYGVFLETEKESGLPTVNQYVYVKIKKGLGHVGQKLMIVKDQGKIEPQTSNFVGKIKANFIEVFGDLELTEKAVSALKSNKENETYDVFRAIILHANDLAIVSYELIPGTIQIVDLKDEGKAGTVTAQVIGASKHKASALYGPGDIIFVDKGKNEGVQVGQILDIFMDRSTRNSNASVAFSTVPSGRVKIVHVDTTCATGVVLRSVDSVLQGDRVQPSLGKVDLPTDTLEMTPMDDYGSDLDGFDDTELDPADDTGIEDSEDFDLSE